jgi:hypothetical protein
VRKQEEKGRRLRESNDRFRNNICGSTSRSREIIEKNEEIPDSY